MWPSRPPDFGDRVLAAYEDDEAEPVVVPSAPAEAASEGSGRRWGWLALAAAVVVGAAAVATLVPRASDDAYGSVVAEQQRTVSIGQRATVVADPGATLTWSTEGDGSVVVEQPKGSAFYRVDSGEPFAVRTPAGVVRVTGTCFAVDVENSESMMNTRTKAGAIGAAVAVAVTVTVYEGSTVLANDAGTVDIGPGQRAVADAGGAPRLESADDDAAEPDHAPPQRDQVAALRAETHRQAAEIAALSNKLAKARGDVTDGEPESEAPQARFAPMGPPIPEGFDHYQPTDEALQQMAECGVVAWDQPPVWADDQQLDPEYLAALGLPEADAAAMQEVFEQFRADTVAQARKFYVELGGKPELAETIDPSELLGLGLRPHRLRRSREWTRCDRDGAGGPGRGPGGRAFADRVLRPLGRGARQPVRGSARRALRCRAGAAAPVQARGLERQANDLGRSVPGLRLDRFAGLTRRTQ